MKEVISFILLERSRYDKAESGRVLSEELYAECRRRWPHFFPAHLTAMEVRGAKNDPIVAEVIEFLRTTGREPYFQRHPSLANRPDLYQTHYQVDCERVFEPSDHAQSDYFWLSARAHIAETGFRHDDGRLRANKLTFTGERVGKILFEGVVLCTDSARREFQAENFIGLCFRAVDIVIPQHPPSDVGAEPLEEELWQLWGNVHMPPLLNRIVNGEGNPYNPEERNGCVVDDPCFPWYLQFPTDQLRRMPPFDIALTREKFGPKSAPTNPGAPDKLLDPALIVSRRFRTWCEQRGFKLNFDPIGLV